MKKNKQHNLAPIYHLLPSILYLLFLFIPTQALSRPMIADVNPRKIDIDQNFKGTNLLIYGARNDAGNVVIVLRGPVEKQILRKKGKVFGVWTNVENIKLNNLSSFYAVDSIKPLDTVQNDELLKNLQIGIDNLAISGKDKLFDVEGEEIRNSVIKLMEEKKLYTKDSTDINFWGETLFRTFITFPKNINNGLYNLDIYLFNDGNLHTYQTMPIIVEKVGIESFISNLADKRPFLYGVVSVLMALIIGVSVGLLFAKKESKI